MTFEYIEDKDEAARIARAALPLAHKFDLPVNPVNYAVLYSFIAGCVPGLSEAVEASLRGDIEPSSNHFRELYHTYILQADEKALELVRSALIQVMEGTGNALRQMDGESRDYEAQLGACLENLETAESANQLSQLLADLREQTLSVQQSSSLLRSELEEARRELDQLRTEFVRVRQESLVDPLTGIANRRAIDASLSEAARAHAERGEPMCLLLLDIDHFKRVNDEHGHLIGDAVLKWFAKILRETVKGTDSVARYGGEEFAVLLPDTGLSGARIVAENIRRRVGAQNLRVGKNLIGRVTCSIGVASVSIECDVTRWIENADSALYRAKEEGRDRVTVHGLQ